MEKGMTLGLMHEIIVMNEEERRGRDKGEKG